MKKSIALLTGLLLTGCSLQDVNVEKPESAPVDISTEENAVVDNSQPDISIEESDNKLRPEIGEKFIPEGMVHSGGYLTVNSAEIFDNLSDAGIEEAQLLDYSLLVNGEPSELTVGVDSSMTVAYDKATGNMINDWKIVKVHYTFENQSAVSTVNDTIILPEEQYSGDIFSVGNLNVCDADDSKMVTRMNYFCYKRIYFSLADSVEYKYKTDPTLFKCSVGEKVEFDIAYAFCCEPENLYVSATTGNKTSTMVDLELGGDS